MKLTDWALKERQNLIDFINYYNNQSLENPDNWPLNLDEEEWEEQYSAFKEMQI